MMLAVVDHFVVVVGDVEVEVAGSRAAGHDGDGGDGDGDDVHRCFQTLCFDY